MFFRLAALSCTSKSIFLWFPRSRYRNIFGLSLVVFRELSCSIMDSSSTFGLYKNVNTILDELTDSKHNGVTAVQELLTIFNSAKQKFEEQHDVKNHPLIVLEGLDGSGKSAMTRHVSTRVHAEKWKTPPESIMHLRPFFDDHSNLRGAYYSLGNYIAAFEVSCILSKKPVLMDRYWHSTTAYAVAEEVANSSNKLILPHPEDDIYKWPSDLLKPDVVLLLNVSEEERLRRHSRRTTASITPQEWRLKSDTKFREEVLQAYKNMREPGVVLVDGNGSIGRTIHLLCDIVKPMVKLPDLELSGKIEKPAGGSGFATNFGTFRIKTAASVKSDDSKK